MPHHRRFPSLWLFFLLLLLIPVYSAAYAQGTCEQTNCVYLPLIDHLGVAPTPTATATFVPTAFPTDTSTPTSIPTPTATPTPILPTLSIKSDHIIRQPGFLYVVGEVLSMGAGSAYFVNIQAKFFDANNQLVATTDGYTVLTLTSSGMVNPFKLTLTNPPDTATQYQLGLTYQSNGSLDYRAITVLSQQVRDNFGVEVFGEVRNDAENTLRPPVVVVTFYDASGGVVDVYSTSINGDLAKGQTTTYTIQTFSQISYTSYKVQAQSYLVP
jgi:hypothetical protein